ncbi:MAG: hypothetical protein ABJD11_11570 [Gemmatimonadota bacterium]
MTDPVVVQAPWPRALVPYRLQLRYTPHLELGPFRQAGLPLLLPGIVIYVVTASAFTRTG